MNEKLRRHALEITAESIRRVLPDYEASRRWLRENGGALLERLPER